MSDRQTDPPYDPDAIFDDDSPIDPIFMADAIQALMRAMPLNTAEPDNAKRRHWQAGLTALAATNPRDPIEVMRGAGDLCVSGSRRLLAGRDEFQHPERGQHAAHFRRLHRCPNLRCHAARDRTAAGEASCGAGWPSRPSSMVQGQGWENIELDRGSHHHGQSSPAIRTAACLTVAGDEMDARGCRFRRSQHGAGPDRGAECGSGPGEHRRHPARRRNGRACGPNTTAGSLPRTPNGAGVPT
jgi:hypothetical protein